MGANRCPGAVPELEGVPRFPALEPGRALESFEIRPGFRLEPAAHEPQVMDPIALSFDERGRMYVVEMRDYSERRPERLGRVRLLEDRDGDGHFERSEVFLDGLPWPTAVTCWDGGVFVGATPDVFYARDEDGDGRADLREPVFTGFAEQYAPYETNRLNVQALMNSFRWGIDCRIHGSSSLSGGNVRLVDSEFTRAWRERAGIRSRPGDTPPAIQLRGRDFSFDPRTLEIRAETGGGQYGMTFSDEGEKFLCSNSDHIQWVRYEPRHGELGRWHSLAPDRVSIALDGPSAEVFRISPEEPWRVIRTRWRVTGVVPGIIEGGGRSSGYFTSATGLTIYRGDAYGDEYLGDAFVADCGSNLVHRKKLRRRGVGFVAERPPDESNREFLASRDTWFRPVEFANAPDGCLWVLDMYREIIEHPWSLPPGLKEHLDLNSGNDRGRIYRIAPERGSLRRRVDLGSATTEELVRLLAHPNGWHRDTASRLLVQKGDPAAIPMLRDSLASAGEPLARLHSLYVLDALGACSGEELLIAIRDASPAVVRHAVRLLELAHRGGELSSELAGALERLASAADAGVRLQLAFALGRVPHPRRAGLLLDILGSAEGVTGEELVSDAALAAAGEDVIPLFQAGLERGSIGPDGMRALARILGRSADAATLRAAISRIAAAPLSERKLGIVAALAEGVRMAGRDPGEVGVRELLAESGPAAAEILKRKAAGAEAGALRDAVQILGAIGGESARRELLGLLAGGHASAVRQAVLTEFFRVSEQAGSRFGDVLEHWPRFTPEVRQAVLDRMLRSPAGARQILDGLAAGALRRGDLSASQLEAMRRLEREEDRRRAFELLGEPPPSRREAVAQALRALELKGDAERGARVYEAQCASCHRLAGKGHALGPDLETVVSQPPEKLLVAIVDPNREVPPNFLATTIETRDGESLTGLILSEDANALRMRQASGVELEIARDNVLEVRPEGRSLMPEGFEGTLSAQDMADLLAYLTRS